MVTAEGRKASWLFTANSATPIMDTNTYERG